MRTRATPIPGEVVIGMAAIALAYGEARVAATFLLSFVGLLRTGEVLSLRVSQLSFVGDGHLCIVALPDSKGAKRKGFAECVLIYDIVIIRFLQRVVRELPPEAPLFLGKWKQLQDSILRYAGLFGYTAAGLTPYCLRRGGATWHFTKYHSLDATQALGRWEHAKTAKIYITQALADTTALSLNSKQERWVVLGRQILQRFPASPVLSAPVE